jgi:hypothetical protein
MLKDGLVKEQSGVKPVSGLADAAYTWGSGKGSGLSFLSGSTICSIVTTVPTTSAAELALAQAILQG